MNAHIKKLLENLFITLGVVEAFRAYKLLYNVNTVNATLYVSWVAEVIEGDAWVVINIRVYQI